MGIEGRIFAAMEEEREREAMKDWRYRTVREHYSGAKIMVLEDGRVAMKHFRHGGAQLSELERLRQALGAEDAVVMGYNEYLSVVFSGISLDGPSAK